MNKYRLITMVLKERGFINSVVLQGHSRGKCGCPITELPPEVPDAIPFAPIIENVPKLKEWILERYKSLSFNMCPHQPLPLVTSSPPMRLYMGESARPVAIHKAPPVPVHWEAQVKEAIDRDVE